MKSPHFMEQKFNLTTKKRILIMKKTVHLSNKTL